MPRDSLSLRERWLAVLRRERPDRMPMDFWGTGEAVAVLMKHLGCGSWREALDKLRVDFVVKLEPRYAGPPLPPGLDAFGRLYNCCRNAGM
jgi:uroporphyrinogen decarboxylase